LPQRGAIRWGGAAIAVAVANSLRKGCFRVFARVDGRSFSVRPARRQTLDVSPEKPQILETVHARSS
jgi:hypothetical protein